MVKELTDAVSVTNNNNVGGKMEHDLIKILNKLSAFYK